MNTRLLLSSALLALLAGGCHSSAAPAGTTQAVGVVLNDRCPRSGKPVSPDSLTSYRGTTVGFCNTHCRDDFVANVAERPDDRAFFDRLLAAARGR